MSWDFWMELDAGGPEPEDLGYEAGYTYNVSNMFYQAFRLPSYRGSGTDEGIRGLNGLTGEQAIPLLQAAIKNMESDPESYVTMEPSNKWGSYAGALELLNRLGGWCFSSPKATLRVE